MFDADATQMFGSENSEVVNLQGPSALEETRMFNADEINEHLSNIEEDEQESIGPWAQAAQEDKRVVLAVEPFAHALVSYTVMRCNLWQTLHGMRFQY